MPKGPQDQRRPADTVAAAIMVAKIATGEIEEKLKTPLGQSPVGRPGGGAREEADARGLAIAKKAAVRHWG